MVKLVFFQREYDEYCGTYGTPEKIALNKRGDDYRYIHVELWVDENNVISNMGKWFTTTPPKSELPIYVFELPVSSRYILDKFNKMKFKRNMRWGDFLNMWEFGYNAKALLGTGYSCANICAYLLGYDDYWKMDCDDLFEALLKVCLPKKVITE